MPTFGNLSLDRCHIATVSACHFEKLHLGLIKAGVVITECGGSALVEGCDFAGFVPELPAPQVPEPATGIVVRPDLKNGPIFIGSNRYANIPTLMNIADVPDLVVLPQYTQDQNYTVVLPASHDGLIGAPHVNRGQVLPDANIRSGFAVPAGITLPTGSLRAGMLAYDSTANRLHLRKGSAWTAVVSDFSVWSNPSIAGFSGQEHIIDTGIRWDSMLVGYNWAVSPGAFRRNGNKIEFVVTNAFWPGSGAPPYAADQSKMQYTATA